MKEIKPSSMFLALICATAFAVAGCKQFGIDTSAPSGLEKQLFTTITNYVDVPVTKVVTNFIIVPQVVYSTNIVGQIVSVTNQVTQPQYQTVTITNVIPQYLNTVSDATKAGASTVGTIANIFAPGTGGLISTGLVALLGLWAQLRSGKRQLTASSLSQEMETVLEFIGALPNGEQYVTALKTYLQQHQGEAGVVTNVVGLLEKDVSNPDAKVAAAGIIATINSLQGATGTKITPPSLV